MCIDSATLINLLIGVIGSLIASILFLQYTKRKDKVAEKGKYAKSVGRYTGYGTKTDKSSILNEERPLSKVDITYLGGNLLQIHLKEINDPHQWQGLISMESNHYGTIIWRYINLHGKEIDPKEHLFGLKKFVFFPRNNKKVAYLMGDITAGYFNEILLESDEH